MGAKRVKQVFTNSQVCHVWASQTQSTGRNSNNSIWFEGDTIYSYGRHFPMARVYTKPDGNKFVLTSSKSYSVTTSGHMSDLRSAISHIASIAVPYPTSLYESANEECLLDRVASMIVGIFNGRCQYSGHLEKSEWNENKSAIERAIDDVNAYRKMRDGDKAETFALDNETMQLLEVIETQKKEKYDAKQAEKRIAQKIAADKYEVEREERRKEYATEIELWETRANTKDIPYDIVPRDYDRIRIKANGTDVETMRGAEVPLSHAVRLLNLAQQGRVKVGDRVGHFTVDKITDETLTIGCHTINIEQATRVLSAVSPRLSIVK